MNHSAQVGGPRLTPNREGQFAGVTGKAPAGDRQRGKAAPPTRQGHGEGPTGAACQGPFPWPLARYPDATPTLVLNTHHTCALRCRYCYAHPLPEDYARGPMTPEVARAAIDFLLDCLRQGADTVAVGHDLLGDPMLAPPFLDEVRAYGQERAAALGVRLDWPQGATLSLTAAGIQETVARFPLSITASLDGPPDVHNRLRPFADGRGSYDTVVGNLRRVRDPRTCPLPPYARVQTVLTSVEPDVTRLFLHFIELGADGISIRPVRLAPGHPVAIDDTSVGAVKDGYTRFGEFLLSREADELLACLRPIFHIYDFFGKFVVRALQGQKVPYGCHAGKWYLAADTDGTLYPCSPFAGARACAMGSIFEGIDPVKQRFWAEEMFIGNRPTCRECQARDLCGGGCAYQAWLATGHPGSPGAVDCDLARHVAATARHVVQELRKRPEVLAAIPLDGRGYEDGVTDDIPHVRSTQLDEATAARALWADWRSAEPLTLAGQKWLHWKRWRGPEDLSAVVHLGSSRESLCARIRVQDDVFVPPDPAAWPRRGDSLEIRLSPVGGTERSAHFRLCAREDGGVLTAYAEDRHSGARDLLRTRAEYAVWREHGAVEYRLAVPWEEVASVPMGDDRVAFSLLIEDDDGSGCGQLEWPGGSNYALVKLAEGRVASQ